MKEQLVQYVNLLFAGSPEAWDIKEEILQNTLDRYDDLVAQGKTPEAAYSLAISGIGDLSEILSSRPIQQVDTTSKNTVQPAQQPVYPAWKAVLRAAGIALYILCPTPLFILSELNMSTIGLCGTLGIVAIATVLCLLGKKTHEKAATAKAINEPISPRQELHKSIHSILWAIGLATYFILSFATNAWYITWVIFPMIGAVSGLISACIDLKEANHNET